MDIALSTFLNPSGLSSVGQDYFKCFSNYGIRVIPAWLGLPEMASVVDPAIAEEMLAAANKPIEEALQFHAGRADDVRFLKNKVAVVGSLVLEGNKLVDEHIQICRDLDVVMTPATFCRNVCVSSGVPREKVFHLPYALDVKTWNPQVAPRRPDNGRFRFLYMNTCYERKGWDLLLRAWWEEFSANDNVELVIKSYREQDRMESLDILVAIERAKLGVDPRRKAPVVVMDELMGAKNIPSFMKGFDCYVSPHRSEGFGLNIWHAMALGVPVVCTDYGGNCDFTKDDTSWLVKVAAMTKPGAHEIKLFKHYRDITWAEPDVADLRRQMRLVMQNKPEAERRAKTGSDFVASAYSYEMVMRCLEQALKKRLPGVWEKLYIGRDIEATARQPSPRFESADKPLRMIEI